MTYTFTQKPSPTEPNQLNWFGNLRRDGSKQPLTGVLGNGIQTTDASSTPQKSPLTVSNTAITNLVIPTNATAVTLISTTNTLNVSELSSLANYFTLPVGVAQTFEVGLQNNLYLEANTGSATVSFVFTIV